MSFPETVDEILDVSEDEGEGLGPSHAVPEWQQPRGRALPFLLAGVGELHGPRVVLQRGRGEPTRLLGQHLLAQVRFPALHGRDLPGSLHGPVPQGQSVCREPLGMQNPTPSPAEPHTVPCSVG